MPFGLQLGSGSFLAWGWLLIGIPVAIHMLMKKKPAELDFPTLRFLRSAQKKQSRRVKFQHLLLLLLRILLILLMLLAFTRPQVKMKASSMLHDEPTDVVLLVDTSLSMQAVVGGGTLLERARAWSRGFIESLPRGSRVAVMTARLTPLEWALRAKDLDTKMAALEPDEELISLGPTIRRARKLLGRMSGRRLNLYILTDLTRAALPPGVLEGWPEQMPVRLVDLAGVELDNAFLEKLSVSQTAVLPGTPVTVGGVIGGRGRAGKMTLDLIVAGRTVKTQTVEMEAGGRRPFSFTFKARTPGPLQGRVRIREQDTLPRDNALFFTVRVFRSLPVKVIGDAAFSRSASWKWLRLALDPEEKGKRLASEQLTPDQLPGRLGGSRVVILPDVTGMTADGWAALEEYVRGGGGLLVLLGPGIRLAEWRTPKARELLGLEVVGPERLPGPTTLRRADWQHPVLAPFKGGANGDLMGVEWRSFQRVVAGAGTKALARLGKQGHPALLERPLGKGRLLMVAGGIDPGWSDLIRSYAFVPLIQETLKHLARLEGIKLNYRAGETARLPLVEKSGRADRVRLVGPSGAARVVAVGADERAASLALDDGPGQYSYLLEGRGRVIDEGGVSANFPTEESDLTRIDPGQAGKHLGFEGLAVLEAKGSLTSPASVGARTRELTPLVVLLLLLLLTVESYISTLRYR